MCRLMIFNGTCTCCGQTFTWHDLAQELSCLEAKNVGAFGECRRGINKEEHTFDQECDECMARNEADEGYGEWEEEEVFGDMNSAKGGGTRDDKGKQKADYYSGHGDPAGETQSEENGRRSKKQRIS